MKEAPSATDTQGKPHAGQTGTHPHPQGPPSSLSGSTRDLRFLRPPHPRPWGGRQFPTPSPGPERPVQVSPGSLAALDPPPSAWPCLRLPGQEHWRGRSPPQLITSCVASVHFPRAPRLSVAICRMGTTTSAVDGAQHRAGSRYAPWTAGALATSAPLSGGCLVCGSPPVPGSLLS